MKKLLALAALIALPTPAFAHVHCGGETFGNTIVSLEINTNGTFGPAEAATVSIVAKDGATRSYTIDVKEMPQFFASTDGDNNQRAVVGVSAFVGGENPVFLRFVGTNRTGDLATNLRDKLRLKEEGNSLRVWKGPGYAADQQHSFKDVVCIVTPDL